MIPSKEKDGYHYLALKTLSALLKGMHQGDFCCLNYLHYFPTKSKLKYHEKSL